MNDRIQFLKKKLKDSPDEAKLKQLLRRNGFVHYMTNRWQIDICGRATIFASKKGNNVTFSANFIIGDADNISKRGFIACADTKISDAKNGLDNIITLLEEKYE